MKLLDFIVCDDVRQEAGNKVSLMGLYDNEIRIQVERAEDQKWPAALPLATYIRILLDEGEPAPDEFVLTGRFNTKETGRAEGKIALPQTQRRLVIALKTPTVLDGEGQLRIALDLKREGRSMASFDTSVDIMLQPMGGAEVPVGMSTRGLP